MSVQEDVLVEINVEPVIVEQISPSKVVFFLAYLTVISYYTIVNGNKLLID